MPLGVPLEAAEVSVVHDTDGPCSAIVRPATYDDLVLWEEWRPFLPPDGDGAWDWKVEVARSDTEDGYLSIALVRVRKDGVLRSLEGLMSVEAHDDGSFLSAKIGDAGILYVNLLACAPENRPNSVCSVGRRAVRFVGTFLVCLATELSSALGYKGRVGIHSKLTEETLDFYRNLQITEVGQDPQSELIYFETEPRHLPAMLARLKQLRNNWPGPDGNHEPQQQEGR